MTLADRSSNAFVNLELRDANPADRSFLFDLYSSTRELELSQVPWTREQKHAFLEMQFSAQTRSYRESHPDATHHVLCIEGAPVGRLYIERRHDRLHILDLTIAPARRNQGIGTQMLRRILEEASQTGKAVTIYTESFNPSLRLFRGLGFEVASVDGFIVLLERPGRGSGDLQAG